MKAVLDANCFIDAINQTSQAYEALQVILNASHLGKNTLFVSLHSLHELEQKPDEALALAKSLPLLPHFPIGTWGEQVGTWSQAAGTCENGMGSLLDFAPPSTEAPRSWLAHFTAGGNDQQ